MNYITNYYKNLSEQLQEQVNHLTKMLNEAVPPPRPPKRGIGLTPDAPTPVVRTVARHHTDNWSTKMRKFIDMNPNEFNSGGLWGETPEFQLYARYHYGIIIQQGGTYQRLTPDGTVQHWTNSGWVTLDTPGTKTFFGHIQEYCKGV